MQNHFLFAKTRRTFTISTHDLKRSAYFERYPGRHLLVPRHHVRLDGFVGRRFKEANHPNTTMPRHVFLALTLFGLFPTFVFAQAVLPATFQPDYEKLAALMNQEEVGALDVAQGSLIASRFFVAGPVGLLPMQDSFNRAQTVGEGSVSGLGLGEGTAPIS